MARAWWLLIVLPLAAMPWAWAHAAEPPAPEPPAPAVDPKSREVKGESLGTIGMGTGYLFVFDGVVGLGERRQTAGNFDSGAQLLLRFEGGVYGLVSGVGNLGGIEFGAETGYDGLPGRDTDGLLGEVGLVFDLWLDFPATLWRVGGEGGDWLRWSVAPGMGVSMQHGYLFLKSQLAARLPVVGDVDLSALWWPGATSDAWRSAEGLNAGTLRASTWLAGLGPGDRLHVFAEWHVAQREHELTSAPDPRVFDGMTGFGGTARYRWQSVLRLGGGVAF